MVRGERKSCTIMWTRLSRSSSSRFRRELVLQRRAAEGRTKTGSRAVHRPTRAFLRHHRAFLRHGRDGDGTQLALSTASMKLSVLVSTHSGDTASTPIVPMRSVLVVITLT